MKLIYLHQWFCEMKSIDSEICGALGCHEKMVSSVYGVRSAGLGCFWHGKYLIGGWHHDNEEEEVNYRKNTK